MGTDLYSCGGSLYAAYYIWIRQNDWTQARYTKILGHRIQACRNNHRPIEITGI